MEKLGAQGAKPGAAATLKRSAGRSRRNPIQGLAYYITNAVYEFIRPFISPSDHGINGQVRLEKVRRAGEDVSSGAVQRRAHCHG